MAKKTQMSSLVNVITVLLVVGAVAWGVVKIRSQWAQTNSDTEEVDRGESEGAVAGRPEEKSEPGVAEETQASGGNIAEAEVDEEQEADTPVQEPVDESDRGEGETAAVGSVGQPARSAQDFSWRQIWADLNLTPEEQARLRQGFGLAVQKWQSMSEEERQAETARMQAMRARWEGMSEDERRETMQRMRGRFEEWRQSGGIELPELSLD